MKKGKGLLWFIIGSAATVFVMKNKWCQEKIQSLKEKGEEVLNRGKETAKEEPQQPSTEE